MAPESSNPPARRPLDVLAERTSRQWTSINAARAQAAQKKQKLEAALAGFATSDASIVVFGSLARDEVTWKSDLDWTLLVDGLANPQHLDVVLDIENALRDLDLEPPGGIGHDFQRALAGIFLEDNGTALYELTKTYGVF